MTRSYAVVDVFSAEPLLGNPVAVILDAAGLDDARMQAIARWTNLSETTFLLPPTSDAADYTLRIFTPRNELPFAGHPTLGSAHAAIEAGIVPAGQTRIVQECGVGLVTIQCDTVDGQRLLNFGLPAGTLTPLVADDVDLLDAIIGQPVRRAPQPAIIDVGAVWIVAEVANPQTLLSLRPDFARMAALEARLGVTGVSLFARYLDGGLEVRSFAPSSGVDEDPVCGSGNGSVALFQARSGMLPGNSRYVARQGGCVGRDGRVRISIDGEGGVTVGGAAVTVATGVLAV